MHFCRKFGAVTGAHVGRGVGTAAQAAPIRINALAWRMVGPSGSKLVSAAGVDALVILVVSLW